MSKDILSSDTKPSLATRTMERAQRAKKEAAALIAVLALSACASGESGSNVEAAPVTPTTSNSATESPTQAPSETVAPVVETESTTVSISEVRGKPTPEQIELAMQGIPGNLNPVEAAEYAGDILNIYNKSAEGEIDPNVPFGFTETAESAEQGRAILEALYGKFVNGEEAQANLRARLILSGHVQASVGLGDEVDILLQYDADPSSVGEEPGRALVEYDAIYTDNLESPNLDYLEEDQLGVTMILARDGDNWTVEQQFVAL